MRPPKGSQESLHLPVRTSLILKSLPEYELFIRDVSATLSSSFYRLSNCPFGERFGVFDSGTQRKSELTELYARWGIQFGYG